jgi:hypothetical protein
MDFRIRLITLGAGLMFAAAGFAQAPAAAPAGSTGLCKDGSYWTGATKRGACHGHKGVKDWYGAATDAAPASGPAAATPAPAAAAAPAPAPAAAPAPARATAPATAPAPGGGSGQVWVNTASKVYHCSGDRWYGKTKAGSYMTESEAVAQGNRPDHGKSCH